MNEVGCYLKKIHTELERQRTYEYREYNLTSTQLDFLEYLYFHDAGQNTLSDIAAFFGVQHTSAIHVIKILEKKGFICRRESSKDSRCKLIFLTVEGRELIRSHLRCPAGFEELLLAHIPEKDRAILEQSLRQMYRNLLRNRPAGFHDGKNTPEIPEKILT